MKPTAGILDYAETLPKATPLCPAGLLHLGNRAAVDQALSRLARSGHLMRICQGVYMLPVETRFGLRAPRLGKALEALSTLWGETIVPCGGAVVLVQAARPISTSRGIRSPLCRRRIISNDNPRRPLSTSETR